MAEDSFIDQVLGGLQKAVEPLTDALASPEEFETFLAEFGWTLDTAADVAALNTAFSSITSKLDDVKTASPTTLVTLIPGLLNDIKDLKNTVATGLYPFNQPEFWKTTDTTAPDQSFPKEVFDYLLMTYLQENVGGVYGILLFAGIFSEDEMPKTPLADTSVPPRAAYFRRSVDWSRLPDFLSNPYSSVLETYAWDSATPFDHKKFLNNLAGLAAFLPVISKSDVISPSLQALYFDARSEDTPDDLRNLILIPAVPSDATDGIAKPVQIAIVAMPIPETGTTTGDPVGFAVMPVIGTGASTEFSFGSNTTLTLSGDISVIPVQVEFRPGEIGLSEISLDALAGRTSFSASVELKTELPADAPLVLFGVAGSSRFELQKAHVSLTVDGTVSDFEYIIEGGADQARVVIDLSSADGFLQNVIGTEPIIIDVPLVVSWSSKKGFCFSGTGALFQVTLPLHLTILDTISIDAISVAIEAPSDDDPSLTIAANAGLTLGPLVGFVENAGFKLTLIENPGSGMLGDLDVGFAFKPPTGLGLSINSQGFTGGGFLFLDNEKGEYAGGLELKFQDAIHLTAIGILNTKLPDGDGFSLLLIISAEFTPIQLSYGFTLNGVGGLLGYNRSMNADALRQGLKNGVLESILFPSDIVANADKILSDIASVFPIREGQFIFGPMAKLGWGTPTIITAELGLLIEVPDPIQLALAGIIESILPDKDHAILKLKVAFIGIISFEEKMISFDASIYDSKLLTFTLSGDMALRIVWGSEPNFLLSVGGFHPDFDPPPLSLPDLQRLTVKLLSGNNPRLSLETYFAVTSNTVQFGARIDAYAEAWEVWIKGHLSFDALFQFSPFYMTVDLDGAVDVGSGSEVLFSVSFHLALSGPTPWHANGYASFRVLLVKVKVKFDKTFGEEQNTTLPDVAVLPLLKAALENPANWIAELPESNNAGVSIREIMLGDNEILASPAGTLGISQKVVPLGLTIDKFGAQKPSDGNEFSISEILVDGEETETSSVEDYFAPANFEEMSDAEKLSRKSYEKMKSGAVLDSLNALESGDYVIRKLEYESVVIDTPRLKFSAGKVDQLLGDFQWLLNGNAASKSQRGQINRKFSALAPAAIETIQESFTVVSTETLSAFDNVSAHGSEAAANAYMNTLLKSDPALKTQVQVVPTYLIDVA